MGHGRKKGVTWSGIKRKLKCYWIQADTAHGMTGQQIKQWFIGQRNSNFIQSVSRLSRWWTHVPKNHLTGVRIQAFFYTKRRGGMAAYCRLFGAGILCSCCCLERSGCNVPVNFHPDKCYSLFCNFLSLYEWASVIPLKVRALRMGCPVHFSYRQHS